MPANEYDVTAYGNVSAFRARIIRLVAVMRPAGSVLEIACGTGLWTQALAEWADLVVAIDAAPEMVAIARGRLGSGKVDVIFFSAWLSHVPRSRFEQFWLILQRMLAEDGRVLFVDEPIDVREKEAYVQGMDEIVERRLNDGRAFRVVKNFIDPVALQDRLRDMGWACQTRRDGVDLVYGEARRARPDRGVDDAVGI